MKVKDFFDNENKWTKGAFARDVLGNKLQHPEDPDAVSWNLSGAIALNYFYFVPEHLKTKEYKDVLAEKMHKICDIIGTKNVWEWECSKERTFEEVKFVIEQVDI